MTQHDQRTAEWMAARCGKVTGSRVADLMARTKSGYSASRANYMAELVCERLTGQQAERFINAAMQRGTEQEPFARTEYEMRHDLLVQEVGFIVHPELDWFGASPDGCIDGDGLIEIKCPNTATHIDTLKSGKPKGDYLIQMQAQLACTGRAWCDFVSYDNRLPEDLAYFETRIVRDDAFIASMMAEIRAFLGELDETVTFLLNLRKPT